MLEEEKKGWDSGRYHLAVSEGGMTWSWSGRAEAGGGLGGAGAVSETRGQPPGMERKRGPHIDAQIMGGLRALKVKTLSLGLGCPLPGLRFEDRHSELECPSWSLVFLLPSRGGGRAGLGCQSPAAHRCNGKAGSTWALRIEYAFLAWVAQSL